MAAPKAGGSRARCTSSKRMTTGSMPWRRASAGGSVPSGQTASGTASRVSRRPVAAGLCVRRCGAVKGASFEVHVGVEVLVGRVEGLVTEPQRDRRDVDRGRRVQQSHRGGVTQRVGGDVLGGEGGAAVAGGG